MPEAISACGSSDKTHGETVSWPARCAESALKCGRHNMPAEPSAFRSPYSQRSTSEASTPSARGSFSGPHMGPPASAPAPSIPQSSGAMSIGSIIEPNMHRSSEYASHPSGPGGLHELSGHTPIGTTPRSLVPELFYGLSPSGDSPLYSSSDSCYSPLSDYLQPQQVVPQPYYPHEGNQRPERGSIDTCFQPISVHSPLSGAPTTPAWGHYDQGPLGFAPETSVLPPVSRSLRLGGLSKREHTQADSSLATTIRIPLALMDGSASHAFLRHGRSTTSAAMAMGKGELLSPPITILRVSNTILTHSFTHSTTTTNHYI